MSRILAAVVVGSFLFFNACSGGASAQTDAEKLAKALGGDKADHPECKLFTRAEVAKYIGEPVSAGHDALGAGCQWLSTAVHGDGSQGDVIVRVLESRYLQRPKLAVGLKELPDVGARGFVAPDLGGWVAGAIVNDEAISVLVAGATASEMSAIALLKESIRRHAS